MKKITIFLFVYSLFSFYFLVAHTPEVDNPTEIPLPALDIRIKEPEVGFVDKIPLSRISAYNPVPRQTWGDPNVSSCGPNLERQIAVSRDLFFDEYGNKHLCGTIVTVITDRGEEFAEYVIWDTMHPRYTNTADILLPTEDEFVAFAFGITTGMLFIHGN